MQNYSFLVLIVSDLSRRRTHLWTEGQGKTISVRRLQWKPKANLILVVYARINGSIQFSYFSNLIHPK